jgi:hypothetical protein
LKEKEPESFARAAIIALAIILGSLLVIGIATAVLKIFYKAKVTRMTEMDNGSVTFQYIYTL